MILIPRNGGDEIGEGLEIGGFGEGGVEVGFDVAKEFAEVVCFECPVCVIAGDCGWVELFGSAVIYGYGMVWCRGQT
jgi:hypothetical protein